MIERMRQILLKEFIHLFRDRHARFSLIVPPLLQMLIFGYAASYEVNRVSTAVLDFDHSQESREFLERITASSRFQVRDVLQNESQIESLLDHRRVVLVLQIQPGFAELLRKGQTAPVQAVLDGTDSNTALIAVGYINQIANRFAADYQLQLADRMKPSLATFAPNIELQERPWYNANLESRWFFVPGVIGTLVLVSVMTLTAFAVVREREIGTLEQLMVTPISPAELIVGKTLPFLIVGLANVVFVGNPGELVVPGSISREYFRSAARHHAVSVERARRRPADFHCQPDPAAGFCDLLLLYLAGDHVVRLRLSDHQHADGSAMVHESRSAALLSDRLARNFHQRHRA